LKEVTAGKAAFFSSKVPIEWKATSGVAMAQTSAVAKAVSLIIVWLEFEEILI
jgi:hypothetical protein